MLGTNEGCVDCNSLGNNDWYYEGTKYQPLIGLKDNITDDDELLSREGSHYLISGVTRVDNSGVKYDVFPVRSSDSATLDFSDSTVLGVADSSKFGEELGCKESTSFGAFEWAVEVIPEYNMLGTNKDSE